MSDQNPNIDLSSLFSFPTLPGSDSTTSIPVTNAGGVPSFFSMDSLSLSPTLLTAPSNLFATTPILSPGRISIAEFSKAVVTALNKFKESADKSDSIDIQKDKEAWLDASALSNLMVRVRAQISTLLGSESSLFNTQQEQLFGYIQGPLATYNGILSTGTGITLQMYNAQVAYKTPPLTQAKTDTYNALVATWTANLSTNNSNIQNGYTAYVAATNALNAQIDANNILITQINDARHASRIFKDIPLQKHVVIITPAPQLLPTVTKGPPPPSSPTVPIGFTPIPKPSFGIVSTAVDIVPNSPAEAEFLTTLQATFNAINSGTLSNLDSELVKISTTLAAMKAAGNDFATYQAYAISANVTLTTLANAYIADVKAFNSTLPLINSKIKAFNVTRKQNGQEPIPKQLAIPVPTLSSILLPTAPPVPSTADFYPTITLIVPNAPVGSITPTSAAAYLESYFNNVFAAELAALQNYTKALTLAEAYNEFKVFYLRGISNVENGYIEKAEATDSSTVASGGAGTGVGITANTMGLQSEALTSIISNAILNAVRLNVKIDANLFNPIVDSLTFGSLQALQQAGLASALPSVVLLNDNATGNGTAAKTTFAITLLNNVNGLIDSGATANSVQKILAASGLSPEAIAELSGPLTAAVNLGLLQVGLLQVSKALGLPGLLAQIVGNSAAGDEVSKALAATSGYGLNDVINNPVSMIVLKLKIIDYIVGQGIWPASTAQSLVNSAMNKILGRNEFLNTTEWAIDLVRGFKAIGLEDASVANIVDLSQDFVRSEQLNQDLDTAYSQQSVNEQSIKNDLYQRQDIQQALNAISVKQEAVESYTLRDFRDDLVNQFQVQGDNLNSARVSADLVLDSIRSNELKNSFKSENINRDQLKASLEKGLVANGNTQASAQVIADSVTSDVISKRLNSEVLSREAIENALAVQGIVAQTAADLSAKAALVLNNVNPLKDTRASEILDHQALAEALNTEVKNRLKKTIGIEDASKIANLLVLSILGPANELPVNVVPPPANVVQPPVNVVQPSANVDPSAPIRVETSSEIVTDQVARPTSVLNQIDHAVKVVRESYKEKANEILAADFREFASPSIDLFNLVSRLLDPGTSLQFVGIMYKGEGNVKIDIRV
ncbi:MAG: hypothetical protein H0U49_01430 [Parachlamydiaceae bacterium]|nr:hypothetical protein [Parachlamydiaceae bacterium]